jgi:hypothetical protein
LIRAAGVAEVTTAYYLVHLMASSANFEKQDRETESDERQSPRHQPYS